jgi:chromosome partitioning protein
MRVLAFASQKSGAGKTTLAGHIAVQAQRAGTASVALIDADPDGSLADWCKLREGLTPKLTRAALTEIPARLDKLRQDGVDLVVIDMPPALNHPVADSLAAADLVAIPTRPCAHDLEAAGATVELVAGQGRPFVFVVNGAAPDGELTSDVVMALAQHGTVARVSIPRSVAFMESMVDGRTVMELTAAPPPDAASAPSPGLDIARLWEYLASRLPQQGAEAERAAAVPPPAAVAAPVPPKPATDMGTIIEQHALRPEQLRRYPRFTYEQAATLAIGEREVECIVHDISAGGALISAGVDLGVGDTVVLQLKSIGPLRAEVRHRDGDRAGLRFTLDPKDQLGLVKHLSAIVAAGTASRAAGE